MIGSLIRMDLQTRSQLMKVNGMIPTTMVTVTTWSISMDKHSGLPTAVMGAELHKEPQLLTAGVAQTVMKTVGPIQQVHG